MTIRHIPEQVVDGKRLGRHVEHDPASRDFPAARSLGPLKRVLWKRAVPPFDQGDLGSCTGNAAAGVLDTVPFHKPYGRLYREPEAVRLYEHATLLDQIPGAYPPDDTGSTGLAVAKAAVAMGLIKGYRHAFGIDHALAALQAGPVITGVDWYEGFDHPSPDGLITIAGQVRGGHEFEVAGYDPATGLVFCWQSWGLGYGKRGAFRMAASTWAQLLAAQGDVTVLVPKP